MALVGYVRISTADQRADLQRDQLQAVGVAKIFEDIGVSGTKTSRPGLDAALEYLREGDVLVTYKLDRVSRSVSHMIQLVEELTGRGIGFRSLTEAIDSTGPAGRFVLLVLSGIASLERDILRERTKAGLDAARARGRVGGRPAALNPTQIAVARAQREAGVPVTQISRQLGVGSSTLYRHLTKEVEPAD